MEKERLDSIQTNIKLLLYKYPFLRNPLRRKQAHVYYWKEFEEIGNLLFEALIKKYPYLTNPETLSREIRKVQELNPKLKPTKEMEMEKYKMAEEYRLNYSHQEK